MTPRAGAAVSGLQGELADQLRLTGEIWEEAGSSIAEPWNSPALARREPTFSLHVTYTTWNYIHNLKNFLLFEPFWFTFSVICSQRQDDKCEPRIKHTSITQVHLSAHPSPPKAAFTVSAPVDSTQYEAGVKKEDTQHWQGKDLLRGLRGEERMCMLNREGQAAQLTSKVVLVPVKCAALLYII